MMQSEFIKAAQTNIKTVGFYYAGDPIVPKGRGQKALKAKHAEIVKQLRIAYKALNEASKLLNCK